MIDVVGVFDAVASRRCGRGRRLRRPTSNSGRISSPRRLCSSNNSISRCRCIMSSSKNNSRRRRLCTSRRRCNSSSSSSRQEQ